MLADFVRVRQRGAGGHRFDLGLDNAPPSGLYRRNALVAGGLSAVARRELGRAEGVVNACRESTGSVPTEPTGESLRWQAACDMLEGYLRFRRGDSETGVSLLQKSVETVARVPAWETPDPAKPPAELLGEVYLALDETDSAARSFRRVLDRRPNRLRSLLGLARAAPEVGAHEQALRELLAGADSRVRETIVP